jgi:hypothetical protein
MSFNTFFERKKGYGKKKILNNWMKLVEDGDPHWM